MLYRCVSYRNKSQSKKGSSKSKDRARPDDTKKTMKKLLKEKKKNDQKKYIKTVVSKAVKSRDKPRRHHDSSTGRSAKSSSLSRKSDSEVYGYFSMDYRQPLLHVQLADIH